MPLRRTALAFSLAAIHFPSVHAQTAPAELAPVDVTGERAGSYKSSSVQVGTFRDLAPLDVPQTSNVVTREVLDAQAASGLFDALRNTAGVTRSQLTGSTYDNIAIRGILVENRGNYRLNGSLPIINLIDVPLENKERAEVLKGASSLYYGFVPPSGIVNLVTRRAGRQDVSNFAVTANQYGGASVHADIGRRFGDAQQFGARVNLVEGREETGIANYGGSRRLASAALDFRASRDLGFRLDLEHYRKEVSEQAAIRLPAASSGRIVLPAVPDNRQNLASEWQKYDAQATNLLFRTDYSINDNWSLLLEAGKARTERDRHFSEFRNDSLASGNGTLLNYFARGQAYENENYRAEITGRLATGPLAHEVSLGYNLNRRSSESGTSATPIGVAQNLYDPVSIARLSPAYTVPSTGSEIRDAGWYLSDRIQISERWQAMAGLRSSSYRSTSTSARYQADDLTPSLSLMFKPNPRTSVYASYIEGLEESGQAPLNRANAGEWLAPAVAKQKEIGAKAEVAQGVLLQAAWFDIRRPSTAVDAANRFVLNGLAEYKGVELAASGEIGRDLSVIASALLLDASQRNEQNPATYGKTPENTPRRTASLFAEYRLRQVPGLAVSGGLFYVGSRPVNNENQASIGGYATLSLGARYSTRIAGKPTTFQAVLDNATDRNYWSTAGNGYIGVGAPRTLKLLARVSF
ncbi:TonB-dependent siderophore receptor|uniref:TonB-dependent siderophore receptor n=1 Tax=Noviherbaspirillum sp. L7-7A TaxID=2850560 RepID=UPI001C2BA1CD|nr:TonB-dependent siderophore receptor [Noviherbaspirillum sp. L7-7A]MBV0879215.1 TonB-dependent siderophore receptor [Noviherbaspirillum sp. L7-7A]